MVIDEVDTDNWGIGGKASPPGGSAAKLSRAAPPRAARGRLKAVLMAYDEKLDARIRDVPSGWEDVSSRKMFGGVCHLLHGNMVAGVWKDS